MPPHVDGGCVVCEYGWNTGDDIQQRVRVGHRVTKFSKTPLLEFLTGNVRNDEVFTLNSIICDKCIAEADKQDSAKFRKKEKSNNLPSKTKKIDNSLNARETRRVKRAHSCNSSNNQPNKVDFSKKPRLASTSKDRNASKIIVTKKKDKLDNAGLHTEVHNNDQSAAGESVGVANTGIDYSVSNSGENIFPVIVDSIKCEALDESFLSTDETPCYSPGKGNISAIVDESLPQVCDPNVLPSVVIKTEPIDDSFEGDPVRIISVETCSAEDHVNSSTNSVHPKLLLKRIDDAFDKNIPSHLTGDKNFICPLCEAVFSSVEVFKDHHLSVHIARRIKCSLCPHIASSDRTIENHMKEVHKQTPKLTCSPCNQTFVHPLTLEQHTRVVHTQKKVSSSVVLGKKSIASFSSHLCPLCKVPFKSMKTLAKHNREAHGGQKYQCKYCNFKCSSDITLKRHDAKVHKQDSIIIHDCTLCDLGFNAVELLEDHAIHSHNLKKTHRCELCGSTFATIVMMRAHKRRHNPYNCSLCNLGFKKKENLENHLVTVHNHDKILNNDLGISSSKLMTLTPISSTVECPETEETTSTSPNDSSCKSPIKFDKDLADEWLKKVRGRPYNEKVQCVFCCKEVTGSHLRTHFRMHSGDEVYICPHCNKRCYQSTNLRKHIKNNHPDQYESPKKPKKKRVQCQFCQITCDNFEALELHLWEHMTEKKYHCQQCEMKFGVEDSFNDHMKIHYFKELKECDGCTRKFKSMGFYEEHVKKCREKWKCDMCEEICQNEVNYKKHLKNSHPTENTQRYDCPEPGCDKTFYDKHRYDDHQITHDKEKRIQCPKCHKKFKRLRPMREHIASKHSSIECNDCGYTFPTILGLVTHRQNAHNLIHCPTCHLHFPNKKTLKNHFATNHPPDGLFRVLLCELCNDVFENETALKKHSLTHNKVFQVCSVEACFVTFEDEDSCRNHMIDQHEELNYACSFCQVEFDSEDTLLDHVSAEHYALKSCDQCDQPFFSTESLEKHLSLHSIDQKYSCSQCDFHAPNRYWFISHNKKFHPNVNGAVNIEECTIREQLFSCSACDAVSVDQTEMHQHVESHLLMKEHAEYQLYLREQNLFEDTTLNQCPYCNTQVADLDALKLHFNESLECATRLSLSNEQLESTQNTASEGTLDPTSIQYIMPDVSNKEILMTTPVTTSTEYSGKDSVTYQLATDNEGQLMLYQSEDGSELVANCDETSLRVLLDSAIISNGQIIIPQGVDLK